MLVAAALLAIATVQPTTAEKPAPIPPAVARPRARWRPSEPVEPACDLPPIEPATRLVVAGFYHASTVSNVAVAGIGVETFVGDIRVAPGSQPITLVVASHGSLLLRFSGATSRIRRLILLSRDGSGAIGIPAARVSFARLTRGCSFPHQLYDGSGEPATSSSSQIAELLGRQPDWIGGIYSLHQATLDGNGLRLEPEPQVRSSTGDAWTDEVRRFYPGGIANLRADGVVSAIRAVPYEVLPSTAGIHQLIRAGALVPAEQSEFARWRDRAHRRDAADQLDQGIIGMNLLRVVRPIEAPIGLCGAHLVTFLTPDPLWVRGDVCHSSILVDDGTVGRNRPPLTTVPSPPLRR